MNSLSAAGQAQKKRSCKFEARLSDFEEKKEQALELAQHKAKATPKTFPFPKEELSSGRRRPRGGVQIDTRIH